MKLSAPIYGLKRKAKALSRQDNIPLHEALDRIAVDEGFRSWSLLAAKLSATSPARTLFARLRPGDLVLLGARPGQGKTLLSLELAIEAMRAGNRAAFFSLECTVDECMDRFRDIGADPAAFASLFEFDGSDAFSAEYIVTRLSDAHKGTLAIIDYLQLLDQKRDTPELMAQVRTLKAFAREKGLILVFISQIDRAYDAASKPIPDIGDVRLPNPLDLKLFDKTCFLNQGEVRFATVT